MAIKDLAIEPFLADLASKASTPGGGSAAAVMGAIGAALASMVCNLTIGKKKYVGVEAEMAAVLAQAETLRHRLIAAIEEDVTAFDAVMRAYAMPKDGEAALATRHAAIQSSLVLATDAPLACARLCRQVIELAAIVSEKGNAQVISDGGVSVLAAHAALRSSALNVYVNARALDDRVAAETRLAELDALLGDAAARTEAVFAQVQQQLA